MSNVDQKKRSTGADHDQLPTSQESRRISANLRDQNFWSRKSDLSAENEMKGEQREREGEKRENWKTQKLRAPS